MVPIAPAPPSIPTVSLLACCADTRVISSMAYLNHLKSSES
jgi:hypothetical protein